MKKKITPEQELKKYVKEISESFKRWKDINENGCNDPAWADGCNMNLVKNHIMYYKNKILDICTENGFQIPKEYYIPTPPDVNHNYMANLKQRGRVKQLSDYGNILVTKKTKYNESQLSLF